VSAPGVPSVPQAPRVGVIDYGAGNLFSLVGALTRAGAAVTVLSAPAPEAGPWALLVLPGVGAFPPAMARLAAAGFPAWLVEEVRGGTPLLGVCLGMQLLFERSSEGGGAEGLGLLPGEVVRLPAGLKVPHMGWNRLRCTAAHPLLDGLEGAWAYFVHSYVVRPARAEDVLAVTDYGGPVAAVVGRGALLGVQFHPEKSGATGRRLLERLVRLAAAGRPGGEPRRPAPVP